jgi:hypothetical protein
MGYTMWMKACVALTLALVATTSCADTDKDDGTPQPACPNGNCNSAGDGAGDNGSGDNGSGGNGICQPDCSQATCTSPKDTCGGECPGVCAAGELGCQSDLHCEPEYACVAKPDGTTTCMPADCTLVVLEPPLCGEPGALCGEQCPECTPSCDGRVCGPDPACGKSCGTCDSDHYCDVLGQCAPGGNFCEGELALTGSPIEPTAVAGEQPEPAGGVIPDATFDLVEIRVYGAPAELPEPRREAIRFFAGAASAEQVIELSDAEPERRLLHGSGPKGTLYTAIVDCPADIDFEDEVFQKVFTVQGSELWFFGPSWISVYQAR